MMPYRGHVERGSVVIDDPVALPDGTLVVVMLVDRTLPTSLRGLARLFPPEDLAEIEVALENVRQVDPNGW